MALNNSWAFVGLEADYCTLFSPATGDAVARALLDVELLGRVSTSAARELRQSISYALPLEPSMEVLGRAT